MTRRGQLYGLLVGIDDYPHPVPKLRGCINDIEAFALYLRARAGGGGAEPDLLLLKNQQATRENVIKGFREHLVKAGAADVALFYYLLLGGSKPSPLGDSFSRG